MDSSSAPKDYESLLAEYTKLKKELRHLQGAGTKFLEKSEYEFNTLLNSLTGYMYAAYENADRANKPSLNNALKTSKLLLGKFDDYLEYLSLIFGGYKKSPAPSSVRLMMRQLNQEFDDILNTKTIKLAFNIDDKIPEYVEADLNVVRKALSKLIENALQHTQHGSVTIAASAVLENAGTITLKFSVSDEGESASVEAINAVLAGGAESAKGVGLQVAKDFLSIVGSSVVAEKNSDKGMTFSFLLDVSHDKVGAEPETEAPADEKALEGVRVLLADDSAIMQQIVRQMLESEGAVVSSASNGEQAVTMFGAGKQDVILMDIEMPVLNGYEAAGKITQLKAESGDSTPIIAMTAHTGKEEYDKCIENGMQRVIIKPFNYEGLMDAVFSELYHREYVSHATEDAGPEKPSLYKFERIAGIDHKEGLKRLGGNEKVYFELLQNFRDGYKEISANISGLVKEGNDNEVKNILHMMKGISGNLSFNEVYDYANKLKDAIEQDSIMDITKYLNLFGNAVDDFVTSFEAVEVEVLYNISELENMDLYLVKTRMAELLEYLSGDTDLGNAIDACDDIFDCISDESEKADFGRIKDSVYSFDTETAVGLLKLFMAKYN